MAVSKILIDGVGIDLTSDTVASANDIAQGKVGHLNDGSVVTGTHSGGVTPTGTIDITENGTHDVTNYASANVNVSGGSVPHLLSTTVYTHVDDWRNDTYGNALNFVKIYCNYNDTTDIKLYVCYIENNNAQSYKADYCMVQRLSASVSQSVNCRGNWINWSSGVSNGRSFWIAPNSTITVMIYSMP